MGMLKFTRVKKLVLLPPEYEVKDYRRNMQYKHADWFDSAVVCTWSAYTHTT
jgi:hypothetical protein